MLRFVIGTAGTGKTTRLQEEVCAAVREEKRALVLAPEQYSFGTEKALYRLLGAEKAMGVEVLSFTRLCDLIFREYGGLAGDTLEDASRCLYMSLALSECQDRLKVYAGRVHGPAFISEMVRQVSEFKNAGVRPADLQRFGDGAPEGTLKEKVGELALIYEVYQAYIDRGGLDPQDDLMRACEMLKDQRFFAGAHVFIDSFKGFTAGEFGLLEHILRQAEEVWMAATADSLYDRSHGFGLFVPVTDTLARMIRLARDNGVAVASPVKLEEPLRFAAPELAFLERELFRGEDGPWKGPAQAVSLYRGQDLYDEIRQIAGEIGRLVREEGCRYRDILLIGRDLSRYEQPLCDVFESRGIPFFLDRREPLSARPLAQAMLCALDAVRLRFDTDTVLRLVKTPLLGFDAGQASRLENYCFVWDVRGAMWTEPFRANPSGFGAPAEDDEQRLEELNALRERVAAPLRRLLECASLCSGTEFIRGLFGYLEEAGLVENLKESALGQDQEFMERESAAYDLLLGIMDQYAGAIGAARLPLARHAELFRLAVSTADMGRIPETLDQVNVGDAGRVRPDAPRAVFVFGANEGVFPAPGGGGGFFSDSEREAMAGAGLELSDTLQSRSLEEIYFAYTALTCARERVFVSYPAADLKGTALYPSAIVRQIEKIFPQAAQRQDGAGILDGVWNEKTAFEAFARCARENSVRAASLLDFLRERGRGEQALRCLNPSPCGEWRMEDASTAGKLFGERMRLTPSRVERYEQCHFAYFCSGGLGMKKPRRAELSPVESGSVIHYVLQCMVSKYSGKGLPSLGPGQAKEEIDRLLEDYLMTAMGGDDGKSARFRYLFRRLSDLLQKLVSRLAEEFAASDFEPLAFEMPIAQDAQVAPQEFLTATGARVLVEGIVDRVDVMKKNGRSYVRVVDYKSGAKTFDLSDVYYGINLQMLIYLFSICQNGRGELEGTIPAGVLYMPARTGFLSAERGTAPETARQMQRQTLRMNGLLLQDLSVLQGMEHEVAGVFIPAKLKSDGSLDPRSSVATLEELGKIRRHVEKLLCDMADNLRRGGVEALPVRHGDFDPCRYCEFRPVCGREDDDPHQAAAAISRQEFFERIEEDDSLGQ
ncbi:MAG: PD-(D/E)XK nuclease family protein [Oscillospiraceae bacterium]|nr:PD-(D/E)XK nuclease family protein [Oscillospiraceae bacterium]